jgi:RNA polymerase sigma factor (sigma-70 family)
VGSNFSSRYPAPGAPGSTGAESAASGSIAAGQQDARQAVSALYEAHAVGLIRLAVVMLGDRPAAEDVVQEAFCGLYRRWDHLHDPGNAQRYVRSSVLNGCRSALRRLQREARSARPDASLETSESAEALALVNAEHQEVLGALHRLPARQREALVLRFRAHQYINPGSVWWASPSGQVVIASPAAHGHGYPGLAVFTGHRYIPLPWSPRIRVAAW